MPWHARYYDMLWSTLEELGIPMGFHSAASAGEVRQIGDVFGPGPACCGTSASIPCPT